jgi:hypothetical protein
MKTIFSNFRPWVLALTIAAALPLPARINVVTLPGRDTVQLTIYNSADLTLVKETRHLTFRKGLNRLEFSWANTLIDPTSVEFRPLSQADKVEVLDVSFPPRVANTLEWRINSEVAGEVVVEIRYFTSGITWNADYVVEAGQDEKAMRLGGYVRVTNHSGEDYENSQIRLVVGVIKLVEDIKQLAQGPVPASAAMPMAVSAPAPAVLGRMRSVAAKAMMDADGIAPGRQQEIIKEGMSEYFLYTVGQQDTVLNGWAKRLPSFQVADVPVTSYYKYERERFGDQVQRYYRFTNAVPSKLGKEPLPDGAVQAFRNASADGLYAYTGRTQVKYIPVGESVELDLGPDREVMIKPRLMNWTKENIRFDNVGNVKGWTIRESWELELQNSRDIAVVADVRRNFKGDWTLTTATPYEKMDATKVKIVRPLAARAKEKITYELVTNFGLNATR